MLGDRKPSQFLTILRNSASGQCNNTVLKSLFMEHLPESVRAILSVSESTDLDNLALIADKIMENQNSHMISDIKTSSYSSNSDLRATVEQLTSKIDQLFTIVNKRNRSRSKSRRRNSENSNSKSPYCFYHKVFGVKARNCKPPCTWSEVNHSQEN